jgi:hypothetical protein
MWNSAQVITDVMGRLLSRQRILLTGGTLEGNFAPYPKQSVGQDSGCRFFNRRPLEVRTHAAFAFGVGVYTLTLDQQHGMQSSPFCCASQESSPISSIFIF